VQTLPTKCLLHHDGHVKKMTAHIYKQLRIPETSENSILKARQPPANL
jgi:hypothetical protein